MRSEAGFSLIETVVAVAAAALIAGMGVVAMRVSAAAVAAPLDAARAASGLTEAAARLRSEAASALAVWVPADPGCSGLSASSVSFMSQDQTGRVVTWTYESRGGSVARTAQSPAPGPAGFADPASAVVPGVTALTATCLTAARTGMWAGTGYVPPDRIVPLAGGAPGGNRLTVVTLHSAAGAQSVHLLPGVMPATFTVVGTPVYHAIVYRVDQTHRSLFGLAQKSHVWIKARVEVSYDRFVNDRSAWCDLDIYGGRDGLDPSDPRTAYRPADPLEQADSIVAACNGTHAPLPAPKFAR